MKTKNNIEAAGYKIGYVIQNWMRNRNTPSLYDYIVNTNEPYSESGYDKSYKYRPYQGIKKLKRFHFSTYFNVTDDVNHRELGTFSLRIDCGD